MYKLCNYSENVEQSDEPPPISLLEQPTCPEKSSADSCKVFPQGKTGWNDWKWQIRNRIRTSDQLVRYLPNLHNNQELTDVIKKYPLAITPYYASLIQRSDVSDPIFQMCVPQPEELFSPSCLSEDPLEENEDMPVPGLVHRYQDRALVIVTTMCASYCRHCTRKRMAGTRECSISARRLQQVTEYLLAHPEISDVIISGGDPLTMSTDALEAVLSSIRSVESVQVIRIGTRVPVVLPMRITPPLVEMLRKYHPLWINTHFNHPNELTPESAAACGRLADAGIPLGNQTVLLRGVNDSAQTIEQLCRGLIQMRVRPYYLYQCDLVRGVEHFRTPLTRGIEIIEYMRGRVSGIAIPSFVVDAPHGGGKIPVMPNYIVSMSPTHTVLRNYEGLMVNYPEPEIKASPRPQTEQPQSLKAGVWGLASGKMSIIQPENMIRNDRRLKIVEKRKKAPVPENAFLFDL
jgi:lysine 2,3-aminomutase